jgi:hypothetical protein
VISFSEESSFDERTTTAQNKDQEGVFSDGIFAAKAVNPQVRGWRLRRIVQDLEEDLLQELLESLDPEDFRYKA